VAAAATGLARLELEPVAGPKKRGLLSSLHRAGRVVELRSVAEGGGVIRRVPRPAVEEREGAHTGIRDWGLAEELQAAD
jgi:hypothetical protein